MLGGAVWPRLPSDQLAADPHTMMMAPFRTATLVAVTAIMMATVMAPVVAVAVVAVLVTAVITVTVVALRIRASAGAKCCCQQASCSDDLGELHGSSSRARRSGMSWLYAASSISFLNGIVGPCACSPGECSRSGSSLQKAEAEERNALGNRERAPSVRCQIDRSQKRTSNLGSSVGSVAPELP